MTPKEKAIEFLKTKKVFYGDDGFEANGEFGEDQVARTMEEYSKEIMLSYSKWIGGLLLLDEDYLRKYESLNDEQLYEIFIKEFSHE